MNRKIELQDAFVAGVEIKLLPLGWGAQKRVAKTAGISSSYLNDILKKRKRATEETRRQIARALEVTYEELLILGRKMDAGHSARAINGCLIYERFSEERACCIYQHAARKAGILKSHFFASNSLKRSRPPGWLDYLSKEIDDGALYDCAKKEVESLQEQIIMKQVPPRSSAASHSLETKSCRI